MYKVINKKVMVNLYKDKKIIRQVELKNRLTDLYLDYVLFKNLPSSIRNEIYPDFLELDEVYTLFSTAYLKFDTTQVITDASTTMDYDYKSQYLSSGDMVLTSDGNIKTLTSNYFFDFIGVPLPDNSLFTGVGFGRNSDAETDYLFSFIDLSGAEIRSTEDVTIGITRYDEIISNEISDDASYLPFRTVSNDERGEISKVILCYGLGGTGARYEYLPSQINWLRTEAGKISLTGFSNFYISDGLYPSDTLYPAGYYSETDDSFEYISSSGNDYYASSPEWTILSNAIKIYFNQNGITKYFDITYIDPITHIITLHSEIYAMTSSTITDTHIMFCGYCLFPQEQGQVQSVVFEYLMINDSTSATRLLETYINKGELDISQNDTEIMIKFLCERGDY